MLDVKVSTLYTYVSRGLIRRVPDEDSRRKLYLRSDLERLRAKSEARSGHRAVAAGALQWGEPVIDSAITSVGEEGFQYRGRDVVPLAEAGTSFESVAELLWSGELPGSEPSWPAPEQLSPAPELLDALLPKDAAPLEALQVAISPMGVGDFARHQAPRRAELNRARRLINSLAALLAAPRSTEHIQSALKAKTVAGAAAVALGAPGSHAEAVLDKALVLCADHELNVSAFAARVTASSGADLYACLAAALAALSGPRHGGMCNRIEALIDEVGEPGRARSVLRRRWQRGDVVPGFGHPLYPQGDPRTAPLLEAAERLAPDDEETAAALRVVELMEEAGHPPPSVDMGLVAAASALKLPPGSAAGLFALGRSAGWIAHILEQRRSGELLRPRARYTGEQSAP